MSQLSTKVRLYCKANGVDTVDFTKDVLLVQEAGQDPKIQSWNLSIDEPTAEQIASYETAGNTQETCLLYTSPSPRDGLLSRMPSSA